jgi:protein-L-isoaspartate(D-aspartate) O-methyltransferase
LGHLQPAEWNTDYAQGRRFRSLGNAERTLPAGHVPSPGNDSRALEVGCGLGELALHLASTGYTLDAVYWSHTARLARRPPRPDARVRLPPHGT